MNSKQTRFSRFYLDEKRRINNIVTIITNIITNIQIKIKKNLWYNVCFIFGNGKTIEDFSLKGIVVVPVDVIADWL